MSRKGVNPGKLIKNVSLIKAKITICVITHVPFMSGYWKDSFDVLKVSLESMILNTQLNVDIFVFDNGSCEKVRSYLMDLLAQGKINYLLLSDRNVGKCEAWNMLFGAVQSEFILYSDCDVYFYPGWETAHLEIFDKFNDVGMVTGMPIRDNVEVYTSSTFEAIGKSKDISITRGKLIPIIYLERIRASVGGTTDIYLNGDLKDLLDVKIEKKGISAYIGAGHFEFMIRSEIARELLPFPTHKLIGIESIIDKLINDKKYLRLSTCNAVVHHIGNSLENDAWWNDLNNNSSIATNLNKKKMHKNLTAKLLRKFSISLYDYISRKFPNS
jgi:hypothetical protein